MQTLDRRGLTPKEREIEAQLDFVAVVIVGSDRRLWKSSGDNRGFWPVKVGVTRNPKAYLQGQDGTWEKVAGHGLVWVHGEHNAERIRAELEAEIAKRGERLRMERAYYDLEPEEAILLLGWVVECSGVDAFDFDERQRRIAFERDRRMRAMMRERTARR